MERRDGRKLDELRPMRALPGYMGNAHGSVLIEAGQTRVICTAMGDDTVPPFLEGTGKGWVTAEYAMLPGSTLTRKKRGADGRATEIKRLIGRSLRSVVDLKALGPRTIYIDCDVIQADGGTRTASITGAYLALWFCVQRYMQEGLLHVNPIQAHVAAVSVGIVDGACLLDLCYREDAGAQADMNLVMTEANEIVEIQGTGETAPFTRDQFDTLLALGEKGVRELIAFQEKLIEGVRTC